MIVGVIVSAGTPVRAVDMAMVVQMQVFIAERTVFGAFAHVLRDAVQVGEAEVQTVGSDVERE